MDPEQEYDLLKVLWDRPQNLTIEPWRAEIANFTPANYTSQPQLTTFGFGNSTHGMMQVRFPKFGPRDDIFLGFSWVETVVRGDCKTSIPLQWGMEVGAFEGRRAAPGQGAHVLTAGFLETGTLFYTNIESVDKSEVPRVDWYSWGGADPLPIYVYDQDRGEQPPHWKAPSRLAPSSPGTPVLQQADQASGLGYFTTIKGFNEALKGLSTTSQRVVRIAPEDAYTLPGYEEHPLYGQALVFVIDVVDVVEHPCPAMLSANCPG